MNSDETQHIFGRPEDVIAREERLRVVLFAGLNQELKGLLSRVRAKQATDHRVDKEALEREIRDLKGRHHAFYKETPPFEADRVMVFPKIDSVPFMWSSRRFRLLISVNSRGRTFDVRIDEEPETDADRLGRMVWRRPKEAPKTVGDNILGAIKKLLGIR